MVTLLLVIIYLSFIGLGLPDSLLGSAWPVMHAQLGAPVSYAGIVSMLIAGGTIIASLMSDRLTKKLSARTVTIIGMLMTSTALFGFTASGSFWILCLFAIPFGIGAGSIDAALNNYVAMHFSSRHMNWLHFFWGVGATISPYIMGFSLTRGWGWETGYMTVSAIQLTIVVILIASLPLWKRHEGAVSGTVEKRAPIRLSNIIKIKGVKIVLPALFAYSAVEITAGLWASSYLVMYRGIAAETAARYASLFYLGITLGRFLSGFIASKVGDRNMVRAGIAVMLTGITMVFLPVRGDWVCLYGLVVIGFGCAPVFPSILHATPTNFGAENSQAIIGVQMAGAYSGSTVIPPLFGLIANRVSIGLFPVFLMLFAVMLLVMTETLNKTVKKRNQ